MASGSSFLWADTMTNLRGVTGSDSSSASEPAILLGGYTAPNDGGGGLFYWDASSSSGDDGGTIIVPTGSTTGRWKRIYTGPLDIRWFGASTSAADNEASIELAIKAAGTPGAAILIPAGTYNLTSLTVPANVALQFENGAVLNPTGIVTILGPVIAHESQQIFAPSARISFFSGLVGNSHTYEVYAAWFGAV
ncbi:MAG: hypothetical protein JO227_07660, partial [Acetobacteraceae bacterium]|nr:hypothetical protein [Acetobacteraceae bacterium]